MNKRFSSYLFCITILHVVAIFGWGWVRSQEAVPARHGFRVHVSTEKLTAQTPVAPVTPKKIVSKTTTSAVPVQPKSEPVETLSSAISTPAVSGAQAATAKEIYIAEIRSKIEANKSYPLISRRMGQTGIVIVAFTLLKDGSIMDLHVHKSSRFDRLDASAVEAVRKVGRFNPIPSEVGESQMDINVPVKFYL
jgi:protein TonB